MFQNLGMRLCNRFRDFKKTSKNYHIYHVFINYIICAFFIFYTVGIEMTDISKYKWVFISIANIREFCAILIIIKLIMQKCRNDPKIGQNLKVFEVSS